MVSSQKRVKTIHIEVREIINLVRHQCKQETAEKSLILQMKEGQAIVECQMQL